VGSMDAQARSGLRIGALAAAPYLG